MGAWAAVARWVGGGVGHGGGGGARRTRGCQVRGWLQAAERHQVEVGVSRGPCHRSWLPRTLVRALWPLSPLSPSSPSLRLSVSVIPCAPFPFKGQFVPLGASHVHGSSAPRWAAPARAQLSPAPASPCPLARPALLPLPSSRCPVPLCVCLSLCVSLVLNLSRIFLCLCLFLSVSSPSPLSLPVSLAQFLSPSVPLSLYASFSLSFPIRRGCSTHLRGCDAPPHPSQHTAAHPVGLHHSHHPHPSRIHPVFLWAE